MSDNEKPSSSVDLNDPRVTAAIDRYWKKNVKIMVVLLAIWAFAGLGCGVLFADVLNEYSLGGFPLGFWFAQQGSIYVFVALIFFYAWRMAAIDKRHGVDED